MITVIDAPCGTGKTTYCINYMKTNPDKRFIYITPFLSECERVRKAVPNMYEPKRTSTGKYKNFLTLLKRGENIVSTHALFQMCTPEIIEYIKNSNYTLIMDEVMCVVEQLPIYKDDIDILKNSELIRIEDDFKIVWLKEDSDSRYNDFKIKCMNESLYYIGNKVLFWLFPHKIFENFSQVILCTYMYDSQIQRYYYDLFKIPYEKKTLKNGKLIDYIHQVSHLDKIHICENNKVNYIGDTRMSLSKNWYAGKSYQQEKEDGLTDTQRSDIRIELLGNTFYNYLRNIVKAKSKDIIWTTFKDYKVKVSGGRFGSAFLPLNTRATNEYMDRHYIVYAINCFINPNEQKFFEKHNIKIDQDLYALSELIQFIYRSAVRNGEDIYVYIPSTRMRTLLRQYIDNKIKL